MEADLEAMRQTLRSLESAIDSRSTESIASLLCPSLTEPARQSVMEAAEARMASLPDDARYALRSDIGQGAVVPIGPERVRLQVTGTVRPEEGDDLPGAVNLVLEAVESEGRRRWLLRGLSFAGVRAAPSQQGLTVWIVVGAGASLLVLALVVFLVRRRRAS